VIAPSRLKAQLLGTWYSADGSGEYLKFDGQGGFLKGYLYRAYDINLWKIFPAGEPPLSSWSVIDGNHIAMTGSDSDTPTTNEVVFLNKDRMMLRISRSMGSARVKLLQDKVWVRDDGTTRGALLGRWIDKDKNYVNTYLPDNKLRIEWRKGSHQEPAQVYKIAYGKDVVEVFGDFSVGKDLTLAVKLNGENLSLDPSGPTEELRRCYEHECPMRPEDRQGSSNILYGMITSIGGWHGLPNLQIKSTSGQTFMATPYIPDGSSERERTRLIDLWMKAGTNMNSGYNVWADCPFVGKFDHEAQAVVVNCKTYVFVPPPGEATGVTLSGKTTSNKPGQSFLSKSGHPVQKTLNYVAGLVGPDGCETKLLSSEPLHSRLKAMMGADYEKFEIRSGMCGWPVEMIGGVVISFNMQQHYGGREESMLAVDPKNDAIMVKILHDGKIFTFREHGHPFNLPSGWMGGHEGWNRAVEVGGTLGYKTVLDESGAKSLLETRINTEFTAATYGNFRSISNGDIMASLPPETQMVNIGKIAVVRVYDLTLTGSTVDAIAKFEWRAKLNPVGAKAYGNDGFGGNGTVRFAKKPDGSWAATTFTLALE
jgi:hypothetical protein